MIRVEGGGDIKGDEGKIPLPGGLSAARLLAKLPQIHLRKHRAALESFTGINTH